MDLVAAEYAYMGEIRLFVGSYAPVGWLLCDGQMLATMMFPSLYSIIGNAYGGDGVTTFKLPDLRGSVPVGAGKKADLTLRELGDSGGAESTLVEIDNMPSHNHDTNSVMQGAIEANGTVKSTNCGYYTNDPANNNFCKSSWTTMPYSNGDTNHKMSDGNVDIDLDVSNLSVETITDMNGGGQSINNMQPYVSVNYIICIDGMYPTRP